MRNLELTQIVSSGQSVHAEHFGGNVVFTRNTTDGVPDSENQLAHSELDISVARYPAGQPDVAYLDGLLIDGALPSHLVNYLTAARENGQRVVIVTPTNEAYDGPEDLVNFTQLVAQEFGDVLHAFEIGNEYWGHQTETSYGQVANDSILAINEGLSLSNTDAPIWIQMGDAGGEFSEFSSENSEDIGWLWRNIGANNLIIDQLSLEARDGIDGVVEHYYFREDSQFFGGLHNDQNIRLDFGIWEAELGADITLNITEWNIRTTNLSQLGMRAASTMIAQFSFMMEIEVDEAYVWPPMHNTSSDLAGGDYVILDDSTGIVINSVGGATFDLMSSSLVGLEYLPSAVTSDSSFIDQYVYASEERVVVYLTSRSNSTEDILFSLGDFWEGAFLSSAIQIGYDQSSSNGQHYDYEQRTMVESEFVLVNNEEYYINEHDVRASIEVQDVSQFGSVSDYAITLLPYEVIELVYELPDYLSVDGTYGDDRISGTADWNELIHSFGGNDNVQSGEGADTIYAGTGSDYVDGSRGNDVIFGEAGADIIRGRIGADELYGGEGNDDVQGSWGNDYLDGGPGDDILDGGSDNDTIVAGNGNDIVISGSGNDTIQLSSLQSYENGWGAFNASNEQQEGTHTFVSIEGYSRYSVIVSGGDGYDTLNLSAANDAFFLHDDFSGLHIDSLDFVLGTELSSSSRFTSIEEINAGAGDDIVDLTSNLTSLQGQSILLDGGSGDDVIWGSVADEQILGGDGADTLFGGAGENTLFGGAGADVFEFTISSLATTVLDFDVAAGDRLRIYESENFHLSDIEAVATGISLLFDHGQSIQLEASQGSIVELLPTIVWDAIDFL